MRLLIVSREHPSDRIYGLGQAMRRIATELTECGHEVRYLSVADWQAQDFARFEKYKRSLRTLARWAGLSPELVAPMAERWVQGALTARQQRADGATHVWFQDPWLAVGYLWHTLFDGKSKAQSHWGVAEHGLGSFAQAVRYDGVNLTPRSLRWLHRLERAILLRAAWVWTPSQTAMAHLGRDLAITSRPAHWHALRYGAPEPVSMTRSDARAALGWREDTEYILAIGRISPVKRMQILVDACAQAQQRLSRPIQLIILGQGDASLIEETVRQTAFEPQILLAQDVRPYLAAADIYLSASRAESFGLANQEAIASGLPCVLASGGATDEIAGHGAWLIDGSTSAFIEAIVALLQDPSLRLHWRSQATAQRQQWPDWKKIIHEYEYMLLSCPQ